MGQIMAALSAVRVLVLMACCQAHSPLDEKSSGKCQSPGARTGRAAGSDIHGVRLFFPSVLPQFHELNSRVAS